MYELSLFTGAGGGILGSKILGWKTLGYVEVNAYRQRILAQRIADGILDAGPIFGDIRAFISEGYALSYQGMVDVVSAGFPCQPFSVAGKGLAENDPRNMWPETIEVIRIVRPRHILLENVPGLLSKPYVRRILGDLAEIFPYIRGGCLSACTVGANHRRTRLWLIADTERRGWCERCSTGGRQEREVADGLCGTESHSALADANGDGCGRLLRQAGQRADIAKFGEDTDRQGIGDRRRRAPREKNVADAEGICERSGLCPNKQNYEKREQAGRGRSRDGRSKRNGSDDWWEIEPRLGRVAHGVAARLDRLEAIGLGQVPRVVAEVWRLLNDE